MNKLFFLFIPIIAFVLKISYSQTLNLEKVHEINIPENLWGRQRINYDYKSIHRTGKVLSNAIVKTIERPNSILIMDINGNTKKEVYNLGVIVKFSPRRKYLITRRSLPTESQKSPQTYIYYVVKSNFDSILFQIQETLEYESFSGIESCYISDMGDAIFCYDFEGYMDFYNRKGEMIHREYFLGDEKCGGLRQLEGEYTLDGEYFVLLTVQRKASRRDGKYHPQISLYTRKGELLWKRFLENERIPSHLKVYQEHNIIVATGYTFKTGPGDMFLGGVYIYNFKGELIYQYPYWGQWSAISKDGKRIIFANLPDAICVNLESKEIIFHKQFFKRSRYKFNKKIVGAYFLNGFDTWILHAEYTGRESPELLFLNREGEIVNKLEFPQMKWLKELSGSNFVNILYMPNGTYLGLPFKDRILFYRIYK